MALEEYRTKRDFKKTAEPKPKLAHSQRQPIFVVQEHHARSLHYDFRLEADGVLKSWAVPKEPSLDPAQKRLAVHVEDHPLDYAKFKGTIPAGSYGAGTVEIWDHGTYENLLEVKPEALTVTEGIDEGRLEFALHGKKLRGKFAFVRMHGRRFGGKQDNWLLIKMNDDFARADGATGKAIAPKPKSRQRSAEPTGNGKARPEIKITNADKVMFPEAGITKGEVVEFYRRIAPLLLPHLRDRPATLERLPDGVGGVHFWQKNTPAYYPDWIQRIELPHAGETVHYVQINNLETLLYLVNQGALTFHTGFSRVQDLDRPDFVLFDLDVGTARFADAVAVAKELHKVLKYLNDEEPLLKTSGKSGLHVLARWKGKGGHTEAREWALMVARHIVSALPKIATIERSIAKRGKRVYVDVMQNALGKHAVPPYGLRTTPTATVSTPLSWRELTEKLDPAQFNLKTIFRRLARQKSDPMAKLTQAPAKATKK